MNMQVSNTAVLFTNIDKATEDNASVAAMRVLIFATTGTSNKNCDFLNALDALKWGAT